MIITVIWFNALKTLNDGKHVSISYKGLGKGSVHTWQGKGQSKRGEHFWKEGRRQGDIILGCTVSYWIKGFNSNALNQKVGTAGEIFGKIWPKAYRDTFFPIFDLRSGQGQGRHEGKWGMQGFGEGTLGGRRELSKFLAFRGGPTGPLP